MALRHKQLQPYMYGKGPFTIESPGAQKQEGETIPRRHPSAKDGLITTPEPDVRTVYELVRRGASKFGNAKAMGSRKIVRTHKETKKVKKVVDGQTQEVDKEWTYFELSQYSYLSFTQYEKLVEQLASGLRKLGMVKGDRLHLFAGTRYVAKQITWPPMLTIIAYTGSLCRMPRAFSRCRSRPPTTPLVWTVSAIRWCRPRRRRCTAIRSSSRRSHRPWRRPRT